MIEHVAHLQQYGIQSRKLCVLQKKREEGKKLWSNCRGFGIQGDVVACREGGRGWWTDGTLLEASRGGLHRGSGLRDVCELALAGLVLSDDSRRQMCSG